MILKIPNQVKEVLASLEKAGFEAFIVGGCVRDLFLDRIPNDWDVTTNAHPDEVMKIFPDQSFCENDFGTVGVKVEKFFPAIGDDLEIIKEKKDKLISIAKKYLKKIDCPIHGIIHAENVLELVREISKDYPNVNKSILEIAAYWHDVGRFINEKNHEKESLRIFKKEAENILLKKEIEIILPILKHNLKRRSMFLEEQILKEADLLDGINEWRIQKAIQNKIDIHIAWIKKDYQEILNYFYLPKSLKLLKSLVQNLEKKTGIKLNIPKEIGKNVVEVTTYRIESGYSDKRRPDKIEFADTLEKDLKRRDFTVNALALKIKKDKHEVVDLFGGQKDLEKKIIKAVGNPQERFGEDALRMMRAIRFMSELGFQIEKKTLEAIKENAKLLNLIAKERIKDELKKIILSENPSEGISMLQKTGLLKFIIPELEKGVGVGQNRHHVYTIFKHNLLSLKFCPSKKLSVRLAALLHDVAKPQTKRGEGYYSTFYNHDHVGARVAEKILKRLRFSKEIIQKVKLLIDNHMFYYNVDEVTQSSVRKLIRKVGLQNMKDLMDLRIADRLGSGTPKAKPYKLRHLEYMIDKVSTDAVSVKMLKINGQDLMKELKMKPGPKIGAILDVLLAQVIEDASKNEKKQLLSQAQKLQKEDLLRLRDMAKEKIEEKKMEDDKVIKKKHWVK